MFRRAGHPAAIEELFIAHFDSIYCFAARRVGRDTALDIAAETFARALRGMDNLDPEREARAWLFGIATNVLRHHHRAEERRLRAYAELAKPAGARRAEQGVIGGDVGSVVQALVALDVRDRETLLLFAWADLSYEEIAAALEIPLGTVRSRIHRARRALRKSLGESDVTGDDRVAVVAHGEA